jgi:aldehyde:ferredoxin oxidoreductase
MGQSFGYVGKILRINLTDQTTSVIPTSKYVPEFLGGRGVCYKIYWDEVKKGVKAFDPENKIIYMTGPSTATGIPTGGRTVFCGISPNSLPEQFTWSGLGGWFGAELKYAGYDGFIVEGRAEKPTYILIEDEKVEFKSAENLWGMLVHQTQRELEKIYSNEYQSIVIGPAGENLVRNASITSSNDNVAAKAGFGAVFGSKNLKAIVVHGTGSVTPYDINKLLKLRKVMGKPQNRLNKIKESNTFIGRRNMEFPIEGGMKMVQVSCSHGCNQHCNAMILDSKSVFYENNINHVEKCVSMRAYKMEEDVGWLPAQTYASELNNIPACLNLSGETPPPNKEDPYYDALYDYRKGDKVNLWSGSFDRGNLINELCNEYGLDKWDAIVWMMTWLAMGKKEGVLDELDLGMEIDVESEEFIYHFFTMLVYRKGYYGNLFAEGMARAIRALGKEKFGDTIYTGRTSNVVPGKRIEIPISYESAWGHCYHWSGRGFQASIDITAWLPIALELMTSTRDAQTVTHHHDTAEHYLAVQEEPWRDRRIAQSAIRNENKTEIKDSVTSCDWQSPDVFWKEMECEIYEAATGVKLTVEDMDRYARKLKNLFRAIIIRDFERNRDMEVNEVMSFLKYPDPYGRTVTEEEWNCLVDLYYEERGWDKETGWPFKETYEECGLDCVIPELDSVNKLPIAEEKGVDLQIYKERT